MSYDLNVSNHTIFHATSTRVIMNPGVVEWMFPSNCSVQACKLKYKISA